MRTPSAALLQLFGLAAVALHQAHGAAWEPRFLDQYPSAVCNDGSPGAYYYRPGNTALRQWLVFLEGAGWCWDVKSCSLPWHKRLGTSVEFPRTPDAVALWARSLQGIFVENGKSPFQDMGIAYVRTCSNDAFMGDSGPQPGAGLQPGRSWHFRGRRIVEAVFADLRKRAGLGDQVGDRVVYAGCSSGGRGVLVSLDYIASAHAGLADVVGLLDSAIWLPLIPRAKNLVSFVEQTRLAFSLMNPGEDFLGKECLKIYNGDQQWKCLIGAYRLPFLRMPFFLTQSQYDLFGISMNVFGHFQPSAQLNVDEQRYAEHYRTTFVKYLPTPMLGSGTTIYSSACYTHCTMTSNEFFSMRADGVALLDAVRHWLSASSAQAATGWIRDRCTGFDCGSNEAQRPLVTGLSPSEGPAVAEPSTVNTPTSTSNWQPRFLEEYPLAICNDGSPAAYYYRQGSPQTRQWLVFLEGAGWCWDAKSCNIPWKIRLGTSIEFPRTPTAVASWASGLRGVFDSTGRSPFKDWHIAYVRTCSNDAFLGDASPQEVTAAKRHEPGPGWHFRGRRILEATFTDLRRRTGLGNQVGDLVLYGGCSSGGRGALVTIDYLAESFVGKADMVGLLDAPLWVPIQPLKPDLVSFNEQTRMFFDLANASGFISKECEATYPGENRWKCLVAAFRLPFVRTPYFLTHSQYDVFGITMNVFGHFLPGHYLTPPQKTYAEEYRQEVLRYLPTPLADSGVAVFSPACYVHCMFADVVFYIIDADGILLKSALHGWLNALSASAATEDLRDRCEGFNCGLGRQRPSEHALQFAPQPAPAPIPAPAVLRVATSTHEDKAQNLLEQVATLLV